MIYWYCELANLCTMYETMYNFIVPRMPTRPASGHLATVNSDSTAETSCDSLVKFESEIMFMLRRAFSSSITLF